MATDESPEQFESPSKPPDESVTENGLEPPTETELETLHEVELGLEWLLRAQGYLIEFHHATGHAMDHLAEAESLCRECGRENLADELRDDVLPFGVVDGDRWSYDVLESFQGTILTEATSLEREVRRELADGNRHLAERLQEREWKRRADRR